MILDLEFVDLDGDGLDELLLLKVGELLVIGAGQSVSSWPVEPLSEEFALTRVDDDEHLDVISSSSTPGHGGLLLGNGDGSFASALTLNLPRASAATQDRLADGRAAGAGRPRRQHSERGAGGGTRQ